MKKLLYVLSDHKSQFICVLLIGLAFNAAFAVIDPLVMKLLIDQGLVKGDLKLFGLFAALVVLFGVAMRAALMAYELFAQKLKNGLVETTTLKMLTSYYGLSYAEITRSESGYFISRIYDEPSKVGQGLVTTLIGLIAGGRRLSGLEDNPSFVVARPGALLSGGAIRSEYQRRLGA